MKTIGILYNPRIAQACSLAEEMAAWVGQQGQQAQVCSVDDAPVVLRWQATDLVVTLGGDGSILRAARAAAPYKAPILGVNLGRVGFLTSTKPDHFESALDTFVRGEHWIERRSALESCIVDEAGKERARSVVLNDIVVHKEGVARVVRLTVWIDEEEMIAGHWASVLRGIPLWPEFGRGPAQMGFDRGGGAIRP